MVWLQRQRYFLDLTLSSLLRRRWKNFSLLLVYSLVVFMISSVLFFSGAIRKEALTILSDAPQMIVQRTIAGRHDLIPQAYVDPIKKIRGVRDVQTRLWGYYYHPAASANYTIMVPMDFIHADDETIIGQGVLRTWTTAGQGQLFFRTYQGTTTTLKIVDTFSGDTELITSDLILISESMFRQIFGVPEGFATDLAVRIRNTNESPTIADKIVNVFPDTRPIVKEEIERTYVSLFDWRSGYVIVLLSGTIMAFFILAWDKATGLSGEEKTEIGILKAVGWDTSDILMLKFWEGMVVCLTAFIMGVVGAYVHVFWASAPLFEHALKGWAILYPAFKLKPEILVYQISLVFALTVIPYTLITIIPSWRVAITDPDAVMRKF